MKTQRHLWNTLKVLRKIYSSETLKIIYFTLSKLFKNY